MSLFERPKYQIHSFIIQTGGMRIITMSNSGARDGMYNQCFWISILDFLNRNGYPQLTLHQLREDAGLDYRTEFLPLDTDEPGYYDAIYRIAQLYNVRIKIYRINNRRQIYSGIYGRANAFGVVHGQDGQVYQMDPQDVFMEDDGPRTINIAQRGLYHFELITHLIDEDADAPAIIPHNKATDTLLTKSKPRSRLVTEPTSGSSASRSSASRPSASGPTASGPTASGPTMPRIYQKSRSASKPSASVSSVSVSTSESSGPGVLYVFFKGKMTNVADIPEAMQKTYLDYEESQGMLRILRQAHDRLDAEFVSLAQLVKLFEGENPRDTSAISEATRRMEELDGEMTEFEKAYEEQYASYKSYKTIIELYENNKI